MGALADRLPGDLSEAARAALALDGYAGERFLKERMTRLGAKIGRDPRTAKRRVDESLRHLAELIVTEDAPEPEEGSDSPYAVRGWDVHSSAVTVLPARSPARIVERRRIVATRPGLDRITVSLSARIPEDGSRPQVDLDMIDGGTLIGTDWLPGGHLRGTVQLPHRLAVGEIYEYAFSATAELGRDPPPTWLLDGVPPGQATRFPGAPVPVGPTGAFEARFIHLLPGLSYGLRWES